MWCTGYKYVVYRLGIFGVYARLGGVQARCMVYRLDYVVYRVREWGVQAGCRCQATCM